VEFKMLCLCAAD